MHRNPPERSGGRYAPEHDDRYQSHSQQPDGEGWGRHEGDQDFYEDGRGGPYRDFGGDDSGGPSRRSGSYGRFTPGSYQEDPGHQGSRGGFWETGGAPNPRRHGPPRTRHGGTYPEDRGGGYDSRGGDGQGWFERAADRIESWFDDGENHGYAQRGSHRGKGPRSYQRSDERIEEDVNDRLSDDDWLDASDIEVSVAEREVTLDGFVDSRSSKRRAEDCAESVSGVDHVQNNLRVRPNGERETSSSTA